MAWQRFVSYLLSHEQDSRDGDAEELGHIQRTVPLTMTMAIVKEDLRTTRIFRKLNEIVIPTAGATSAQGASHRQLDSCRSCWTKVVTVE